MNRIYCVVALALQIFLPNFCAAQANQIFFQETANQEEDKCYNITLRSINNGDELLSSQNFRFYYDASVLRFDRLASRSLLSTDGYSELKVMQAVHNSNALGFGGLEFAANLGYVNLSLNDKTESNLLPIPNDTNLELAQICFEVTDPSNDPTLVWARDPLTAGYSSAYTEIARYKNGSLSVLEDLEFQDIDANWTSHPEKMVDLGTPVNKR